MFAKQTAKKEASQSPSKGNSQGPYISQAEGSSPKRPIEMDGTLSPSSIMGTPSKKQKGEENPGTSSLKRAMSDDPGETPDPKRIKSGVSIDVKPNPSTPRKLGKIKVRNKSEASPSSSKVCAPF